MVICGANLYWKSRRCMKNRRLVRGVVIVVELGNGGNEFYMVMLSEEFKRRGEGGGTVRRAAAGRSRPANHHAPSGHGVQRYPGAAAHTRLGGGTGFRGDEVDYGAGNAPLPLNPGAAVLMRQQLQSPGVYPVNVMINGNKHVHWSIVVGAGTAELSPATYTRFGIAEMSLYSCWSAAGRKGSAGQPAPVAAWPTNVWKSGWFTGSSGEMNILRYSLGVEEGTTHGPR